jgi:hypothetical protein
MTQCSRDSFNVDIANMFAILGEEFIAYKYGTVFVLKVVVPVCQPRNPFELVFEGL